LVDNEGEIVRTDTGSTSIPLLVSFNGKSRYCGDEAQAQSATDTLPLIILAGKSVNEAKSSSLSCHRRMKLIEENNKLVAEVNYCNESKTFNIPQLIAISLSKMYSRICTVYGPDTRLVFPTIPGGNKHFEKAIRDACYISGIDNSTVFTMDPVDCLIATYVRKLQALLPADRALLNDKKALLIEMGHTQTTIVVVGIDSEGPKKVGYAYSDTVGALYFDLQLFEHFSKVCSTKHNVNVVPGSKQGQRLLGGCERIRKLLSQLPESSITVENMSDNGDISFTMRRDDFANACKDILDKFKDLIISAITSAGVTLPLSDHNDIAAVEILGGGVRMQIVQAAIFDIVGKDTHLGAKFDDGSIALGAALLATAAASGAGDSSDDKMKEYEGIGLSQEELHAAREQEIAMQATDAEISAILAARNEIDAYIL
jgi:molecular chaperone DnaK (HSP70)